ncbi:hypothetical protein C2R51_04110 [Helicobacter pylori]|nr:hypothetical protein C2R51_04110 [Helicobacter pylori]
MEKSNQPPKLSSCLTQNFSRFGSVLKIQAEIYPINFLIFSVFRVLSIFSKRKLFECFLRLFGCVC